MQCGTRSDPPLLRFGRAGTTMMPQGGEADPKKTLEKMIVYAYPFSNLIHIWNCYFPHPK
jgi:hypothetical protein